MAGKPLTKGSEVAHIPNSEYGNPYLPLAEPLNARQFLPCGSAGGSRPVPRTHQILAQVDAQAAHLQNAGCRMQASGGAGWKVMSNGDPLVTGCTCGPAAVLAHE